MSQRHFFISYSTADAQDFAIQLHDALEGGYPKHQAWLDKRDLKPSEKWYTQIDDAIRDCEAVLFVMTPDSVMEVSECDKEISRALSYKKTVIPIRLKECQTPYRLESLQWIDFSDFDSGIAELRTHLEWVQSPAGELRRMEVELLNMQRQRNRSPESDYPRIDKAMSLLSERIKEQKFAVEHPEEARERTTKSIEASLERERQPADRPKSGTKFINYAPATVPDYFQDRFTETNLLADFVQNDHQRIFHLVGRAGIGKTAVTVRLLKHLEGGILPDDKGEQTVDGIIYLSEVGSRDIKIAHLYPDLCRLLPDEVSEELDALFREPTTSISVKMTQLLSHFPPDKRVLVLLDNFEDVMDSEKQVISDSELDEALRALVSAPPHGVKVLITTRVLASKLYLHQSQRQANHVLGEGLKKPYAEDMLKQMDSGSLGLKDAPDDKLSEACDKVRRFPRALEALVGWLEVDVSAILDEVLDVAEALPDNVVEVLVAQAFNRLDRSAQQVIQALAIFGRPVSSGAVDTLLRPYAPTINSAPILRQLLNWHFVRQDSGRYTLHPVDRAYALDLIPRGEDSDRFESGDPVFTQIALYHLGAEYFKSQRTPRSDWKTIADLEPQLAEFDLRCQAGDWDTAADVLTDIDFDYLLLWGYYTLMIELHQGLQGHIRDKFLQMVSVGNLGTAYRRIGEIRQAITYYEQGLQIARDMKSKSNEGVWLGGLGIAYRQLGDIDKAIDYYEQALQIARDIGNKSSEGNHLGNLGVAYRALGNIKKAIDYTQQALARQQAIGDKSGESVLFENLGHLMLDKGDWVKAEGNYQDAIRLADGIGFNQVQHYARHGLALTYLYQNKLSSSQQTIEQALTYDVPENNHNAHVARGMILLKQDDRETAHQVFAKTVTVCDEMLALSADNYEVSDAKGLALCGFALLEGSTDRVTEAKAIFVQVRQKTSNLKGHIAFIQQQFDVLASLDERGLLVGVREAIATPL